MARALGLMIGLVLAALTPAAGSPLDPADMASRADTIQQDAQAADRVIQAQASADKALAKTSDQAESLAEHKLAKATKFAGHAEQEARSQVAAVAREEGLVAQTTAKKEAALQAANRLEREIGLANTTTARAAHNQRKAQSELQKAEAELAGAEQLSREREGLLDQARAAKNQAEARMQAAQVDSNAAQHKLEQDRDDAKLVGSRLSDATKKRDSVQLEVDRARREIDTLTALLHTTTAKLAAARHKSKGLALLKEADAAKEKAAATQEAELAAQVRAASQAEEAARKAAHLAMLNSMDMSKMSASELQAHSKAKQLAQQELQRVQSEARLAEEAHAQAVAADDLAQAAAEHTKRLHRLNAELANAKQKLATAQNTQQTATKLARQAKDEKSQASENAADATSRREKAEAQVQQTVRTHIPPGTSTVEAQFLLKQAKRRVHQATSDLHRVIDEEHSLLDRAKHAATREKSAQDSLSTAIEKQQKEFRFAEEISNDVDEANRALHKVKAEQELAQTRATEAAARDKRAKAAVAEAARNAAQAAQEFEQSKEATSDAIQAEVQQVSQAEEKAVPTSLANE
eukprot:TRINITY_DN10043_c0_g1_i10.p1 TRINITY_DN10043_c0_g1~~TRINITY_DN10043_c0_g1_i10.p1  ORF type:complete len:578 (+),score=186.69 TRINITY_DN10043_c0_g1_i10:40-1773(+)